VPVEEDLRDEPVKDAGEQQGHHVKDDDVGEEVSKVGLARQLEVAHLHVGVTAVVDGGGLGQPQQPGQRVQAREEPDDDDDILGPVDGAHRLGLHGVADGDVALHGEGRQAERRRVDAQILEEGEDGATPRPPDPLIAHDVVAEDLVGYRRHQDDAIGRCKTHQVAVGGRVHAPRPVHHRDHQQVTQDAHQEDQALEEGTNDAVVRRIERWVLLLPWRAVHQSHFRQDVLLSSIRTISIIQQQQQKQIQMLPKRSFT